MKLRKIIIVFVIIIILIIGIFTLFNFFIKRISNISILNLSNSDLNYIYDDNNLGNGLYQYNNLKHSNITTGNFDASYSFVNELNDEGTDISFIDYHSDTSNGYTKVIHNLGKHTEIMEVYDGPLGSASNTNENYFDDISSGIIEFYVAVDSVILNKRIELTWFDDTTSAFALVFNVDSGGLLKYYDGTFHTLITFIADTWYHIKLDFDCSTDTYDIYIDFILYVNNANFVNNVDNLNKHRINTVGVASDYSGFFDAIGYTWFDNYTLWNNEKPNIEIVSSDLLTNNKYEFNMDTNELPIAYDYENQGKDYTDDIVDWEKVDPSASNHVYIQNGYYHRTYYNVLNMNYSDNGVIVDNYGFSGAQGGIKNDNLDIEGTHYNITFDFRFINDGSLGSDNKLYLQVYALDGTEALRLRLMYDPVTPNKYVLYNYFGTTYYQIASLYNTDSMHNLFSMNVYVEPIYTTTWFYYQHILVFCNDTNVINYKTEIISYDRLPGISEIRIYTQSPYDDMITRIENVGLYQYNNSICNEKGYITSYNTKNDNYDSNLANIVQLNGINNGTSYTYGYHSINGWSPFVYINKSGNSFFNNFYNNTYALPDNILHRYQNATLYLVNNQYINTTSFSYSIIGLILICNDVIYGPQYEFSENVNPNVSYFYVIGTRMYYYFNNTNLSTLDFMTVTFDIPDLTTNNYTFSTASYKSSSYIASELRVYLYDNTYQYFVSKNYRSNINMIFPADRFVNYLYYLVTDNNISAIGDVSGYYESFTFIYYPELSISYSTLSLLGILPILINILVLPILVIIRTKFRFLFIPLVILMTVISIALDLIPIWLGVIIIIFSIAFYLIKEKRE